MRGGAGPRHGRGGAARHVTSGGFLTVTNGNVHSVNADFYIFYM